MNTDAKLPITTKIVNFAIGMPANDFLNEDYIFFHVISYGDLLFPHGNFNRTIILFVLTAVVAFCMQ